MERLTFAGIERKKHPLYRDYVSDILDDREVIADNDDDIIEEMLKEYERYYHGKTQASGEWNWIQENMQSEYRQALAEGDKNFLVPMYRNFFRNQISFGISAPDTDSEKQRQILANDILLDIDTWREFCKDSHLTALGTPNIGNPFGITVDGTLIMYNSCRHYYHAMKLKSLAGERSRPVILEIGAGYGGAFYFLSHMTNSFCYLVCDLMETLLTNYYFTKKWGAMEGKEIAVKWALDGNINRGDINKYQLILIPSTNHGNLDTGIDIAYNANSFSEMSYEDISNYFTTIARNEPQYIFHQNSNFRLWETSSRGHTEILAEDFPIPPEYQLIYQAISPWTGAGGRYREYLYERRK